MNQQWIPVRSWLSKAVPVAVVAAMLAGCGAGAASSKPASSKPAATGTAASSASSGGSASSGSYGSSASKSAAKKIDTTPVVVAYDSPPDVGDLPSLLAIHMMQQEGYKISHKVFNGTPQAIDAIVSNEAQITNTAIPGLLQADANGDGLVAFAEKVDNQDSLVAESKYKTVKDLNGTRLALASPSTQTHALTLWTEQKYGMHVKILYIGSSSVRVKALLAHQVESTLLETDDVARILRESPKGFHILIQYYKVMPWLLGPVFDAKASFIKAHPSIVAAFAKALEAAGKQAYQHPQADEKAAPKYLVGYTPQVVKQSMQESVAATIWGPPSAPSKVTTQMAKQSLQFFVQTKDISPTVAKKAANLSWFTGQFWK